jgi:hypothetical protein
MHLRIQLGHRTFGVVLAMVFADLAESLAAARRLHCRHGARTGTFPRGCQFAAIGLLRQVVPTLR